MFLCTDYCAVQKVAENRGWLYVNDANLENVVQFFFFFKCKAHGICWYIILLAFKKIPCQYHKCIAPDKLFPVEGQEVWKELLSLFQIAFVSSNLKGLLEIKTIRWFSVLYSQFIFIILHENVLLYLITYQIYAIFKL